MTLYCGAYLPDRGLSESLFVGALTNVAANLTRMKSNSAQTSEPHVDLYFLIPTETDVPGFNGMRFHSYDQAHKTLRMESSVPAHMIGSRNSGAYIIAAMRDAIDNAADFFVSQGIGFDHDGYDEMIQILAEGVTA